MTAFDPTWLSTARFLSAIARASFVDPPRLEIGIPPLHQTRSDAIPFPRSAPDAARARTDEEHDQGAEAREPEQVADVTVEAAPGEHRQVDQQRLRRGRRQLRGVDRFRLVAQPAGGV